MPQTKFLRSPVSSLPPFSRPHLVHPHLNLKVKCKVNKCIHLIIATVLFGRVIFTKCFFSKLQLTELLPGKGYRLVWSGCEVNGLLSRLIELLGMQAFLRRPKFKYQRINFIFKGWPYKSVMGATVSCFMLLPGKIFQLMKKENALISALEVKFIFLLASESFVTWVPLSPSFEGLCDVLGSWSGSSESRWSKILLVISEVVTQSSVQRFFRS